MTRSAIAVFNWAVGPLVLACSTTSRNNLEKVAANGGAAGEASSPTSMSAGATGGSGSPAVGSGGDGSGATGGQGGAAGDNGNASETATDGPSPGGSTDTGSSGGISGTSSTSGATSATGTTGGGGSGTCALTECGTLCTDVGDDPDHCGRCDHSCQSGDCVNGKCQPVILAPNRTEPWGIAVSEEYLYWVDRGTGIIYRLILADGSASPLSLEGSANCTSAGGGVVVDGTFVYWAAGYTCRKPHDGGDEDTLGTDMFTQGTDAVQFLALNSTTVYALCYLDNWIGTPDQGSYAYPQFVSGIAADDNGLYWLEQRPAASGDVIGSVMRTDPTTIFNGAESLASGPITEGEGAISEGIAVYDNRVYWTTSTSPTDATGAVYSTSTSGAGGVQTIATDQTNPSVIAVDASGVYWTNRSTTAGAVMHASLLGGDAVAIATDQNGPHGITLDAHTIYWTNSDGGEVMKLAKE